MSLTELQKSKIVVEIDNLVKKMECLKKDLKKEEEDNRFAWSRCGSELCAGAMEEKEVYLKKEIASVEEEILELESVLEGKTDIQEIETLQTKMQKIIEEERKLSEENEACSKRLKKLAVIKKVLQ